MPRNHIIPEVQSIHDITGIDKETIKIVLKALYPAMERQFDDGKEFSLPKICRIQRITRWRKNYYHPRFQCKMPGGYVQEIKFKLNYYLKRKNKIELCDY